MQQHNFLKKIEEIEKKKSVKIGLCLAQLNSPDNYFQKNADVLFPAASIIKILLALTILNKIQNKELALSDAIKTKKSDFVVGASIIADMQNKEFLISDLLYFLLAHSDNTAQVILERCVKEREVQNFMEECGIDNYVYLPYKKQTKNSISLISPYKIYKIFKLLYEEKILDKKTRNMFFLYLAKTRALHMGLRNLPTKINERNPEIINFYSKYGKRQDNINELIMLETKKGDIFNLNFFITGLKIKKYFNNVDNEGAILLSQLALLGYNYLNSAK